ncbi:MAG: ATP/GTP-binding protein [Candidatus Micrarchaeota archaeon]
MNLFFLGTAGSGKTLLVRAFGEYLEKQGCDVRYANLDAGADFVPYSPDFDVRKLFSVAALMKKYRLGPNGAMIKSAELMVRNAKKIKKELARKCDFTLIDTPGQLEIFVFHSSGPEIVRHAPRALGIFLADATLIKKPSDLLMLHLLNIATRLRLGAPTIMAVSKADLLKSDARKYFENPGEARALLEGEIETGLETDLRRELARVIEGISKTQRYVATSARKREGMRELFDIINEARCACGDLG